MNIKEIKLRKDILNKYMNMYSEDAIKAINLFSNRVKYGNVVFIKSDDALMEIDDLFFDTDCTIRYKTDIFKLIKHVVMIADFETLQDMYDSLNN